MDAKRSRPSLDSSPQSPPRPSKRPKDERLKFITPSEYYLNYTAVKGELKTKCREVIDDHALREDGPPSDLKGLAVVLARLSRVVNEPRNAKPRPPAYFRSILAEDLEPLRSWIADCVPEDDLRDGESEWFMDLLKLGEWGSQCSRNNDWGSNTSTLLEDLYVGPPVDHNLREDPSAQHRSDMQTGKY